MIASLNRLVDLIEEHLTEDIDLASLTSELGTTEYHLRRMFSSLAGMPLSEYIRRRRMTVAAADVLGHSTVLAIAVRENDMRLLITGAPGAGKGSQAEFLSAHLGVPAISTGDLFREHVREGTALGRQVEAVMRAGDYVPDSVTNEMVRERLQREDAREGFILDGYPRTPDQVTELDGMLAAQGATIDAVVNLVVPVEELIPRLLSRGAASGRADDTADSIRHRISVFESVTAPILAMYAERDLATDVDGLGMQREVSERILQAIAERAQSRG